MDTARYAALFQAEAREHLAELDTALLALEDSARSGGDAMSTSAHVATLFRGMHTIKGMAGSMGYATIERLAHALESRCEPLRAGDEALHDDLLSLLFEGTDLLRGAIDDIARGVETPPATIGGLLVRLRRPMTPEESTTAAVSIAATRQTAPAPPPDAANVRHLDVRLVDDCPLKGVRAMLALAKLTPLGQLRGTHPEQSRWQDDAFDGVFRVTIASDVTDDALVQAVRSAGDVARVHVRVPALASQQVQQALSSASAPESSRTVRIDARRLDTLLDLVGELVITRDRLLRSIEALDHPDRDVQRAARDAARLVSAMQDEVLQARLLPVGQVFDRFPRLVRDVSRELGKDVSFVMEGREIELDRSLLDAIGDPILHLLRNALDHGIESAAARDAAGKPARGELILRAARDRAAVVIQVQDDGRGIDRGVVLQRAQEQGLVPSELERLDDETLLRVIAHPGFSTSRRVTSLSGRGVGVDVVNTRVRALGGQLELESIEGVGTVVTLRLPVTLAITRALLVEVGGSTFALPTTHVEEALEYHESLRVRHADRPSVTLRDAVVPLVALGEHFGLVRSSTTGRIGDGADSGREQHLAIVESGGRRIALLVDALVAQQDIVVKPLDVVRGAAPWFSGATVLGDGSPALIIDVPSIV
jgi:two-component system, chemotaxis family, sensor kinase CheA